MATENPIPPAISASENQFTPYFLHSGDNPRAVFVSQILNGENYPSWCRSMEMALSAKNKLTFVDGTLPKPSSSNASY